MALWGLGNLGGHVDGVIARELYGVAIGHKSAAVRADAVRRYASVGASDLRERLEAVLFDRSRGPRDAAAYLLNNLFQISARGIWRRVIDSGTDGRVHIIVTALSTAAEPEDAARFVPFLNDPSARLRAVALRGLARAKAPRFDEYVMAALQDQSGLVVRCALNMLSREGQLLDREPLERAYAGALTQRVRRQLIRAAPLLGKWEALAFLLPLASAEDSALVGEEIDHWLQSANRRFTALDAETRNKLIDLVRRRKALGADRRWDRIEGTLKDW